MRAVAISHPENLIQVARNSPDPWRVQQFSCSVEIKSLEKSTRLQQIRLQEQGQKKVFPCSEETQSSEKKPDCSRSDCKKKISKVHPCSVEPYSSDKVPDCSRSDCKKLQINYNCSDCNIKLIKIIPAQRKFQSSKLMIIIHCCLHDCCLHDCRLHDCHHYTRCRQLSLFSYPPLLID